MQKVKGECSLGAGNEQNTSQLRCFTGYVQVRLPVTFELFSYIDAHSVSPNRARLALDAKLS